MFKNMSLKNKIILGFALILVISAIPTVSLLSGLYNATSNTEKIYSDIYALSMDINSVKSDVLKMDNIVGEAVISQNLFVSELYIEDIIKIQRNLDATLEKLKNSQLYESDVNNLMKSTEQWKVYRNKCFEQLHNEDYAKAGLIYKTDIKDKTNYIVDFADSVCKYISDDGERYMEAVEEHKHLSVAIVCILFVLKLSVTIFIVVKLVRSVTVPLKNIKSIINLVSNNNFKDFIKYDRQDEFRIIVDVYNKLILQLHKLQKKIKESEEESQEETKADDEGADI